MMFEGGGSDVEAGGKSRKENRRETWAPGLGMSSSCPSLQGSESTLHAAVELQEKSESPLPAIQPAL